MNMQRLKEIYPNTVFGCQFAITLTERTNNYGAPGIKGERINPLVTIWSEDDEDWSEAHHFDISWLPELRKLLTLVGSQVTVEWPVHGPLRME